MTTESGRRRADRDPVRKRPTALPPRTDKGTSDIDTKFGESARWLEIRDAAAAEFAANGYKAASIQRIADRVGITKPSIYHYIDSKEDLLFHVLIQIHDVHLVNFDQYASVPGGPVERVRAFIKGHVEVNIEYIELGGIFYLNFDDLSESRRDLILERRRQFDEFLRNEIREGKSAGLFRPDVDEGLASLAILTSVNSMYLWWDPDHEDTVDVAEQFATLFVRGLLLPDTADRQ